MFRRTHGQRPARAVAGRPGWRTRLYFVWTCLLLWGGAAPQLALADPDALVLRHRAMVDIAESAGESDGDRCLTCHGSLIEFTPPAHSPAGLAVRDAQAWYQRVPTYQGPQHNFHWRHLMSPFARRVMRPDCDTCHPGFDPRKPLPATADPGTQRPLRKRVNPALCVNCHGAYPDHREEFSGSWTETRHEFDNTCLVCHRGDAAKRHNHALLNKDDILQLAQTQPEVCYGCHGGRAWYAVSQAAIRGSAFDWSGKSTVPPSSPDQRLIVR